MGWWVGCGGCSGAVAQLPSSSLEVSVCRMPMTEAPGWGGGWGKLRMKSGGKRGEGGEVREQFVYI